MRRFNQVVLASSLFVSLTACSKPVTYSYLLSHPAALHKQLVTCQAETSKTQEQVKTCQMAMAAASKFEATVDEAQQNPEKFGERILKLESDYGKAKEAVHTAKQKMDALSNEHASLLSIKAATAQLAHEQQKSSDMQQELRLLLAVVGLSGPQ